MKPTFEAAIDKSDKWYIGWVDAVPGTLSQGKTILERRRTTRRKPCSSYWKASLSPTYSLQEVLFINFQLFKNIRKKVWANSFGRMDRERGSAAVPMVEYRMTAFLPNFFEP